MRRHGALLVLMLAAVAAAAGSLVPGMSSRPAAMTQAAGPAFPPEEPDVAKAVFASGCFWCTQFDFDKLDGVVETTTGYIGGWSKRPTYYQVATGRTGHVEALQVKYDPGKLSFGRLLDYYWRHVDPLDGGGQFCDRGNEYRPVIFTTTESQAREAEASPLPREDSTPPVTKINLVFMACRPCFTGPSRRPRRNAPTGGPLGRARLTRPLRPRMFSRAK